MKKFIIIALTAALSASLIVMPAHAAESATETISYNYAYDAGSGYSSETAHTRQMEKLDRGLVAVNTSSGVYLSWRLWDSEDARYGSADSNVEFNVYRGNEKIATISDKTNYTDTSGTTSSTYSVAPVVNEVEGDKCEEVTVYGTNYFDIPIDKPASVTLADGNTYSYSANDASCGDLDGDGDYELILKWDCNGKDNSHSGYTGNVLLDAYDLDGTKLWRIDLGPNIRAGAHYTQFVVYDLDGDGKAEIACKTAPGSKDSTGEYVSKASLVDSIKNLTDEENETSYVGDGGFITTGPEYYTVFDGEGKAIDTIEYLYSRDSGSGFWGRTSNGSIDTTNRVDRFLGAVAYLDGVNPSVIAWRGYYDRTTAAAYTLENGRLQLSAKFDTDDINKTFIGQGNHNITVADVDSDGKDEVITGALCLDDDFSIKWCSGRGHGDALHIGDYDPTHHGLEYFSVHESGGYTISSSTTSSQGQTADYGMTVYDAETGEELYHQGNSKDTGRGAMANIGSGGYYQISGSANMKAEGNGVFSSASAGPGSNFRIFWDGDLYDEILDGTTVSNWNGSRVSTEFSASGCTSVNGTKANPGLQADLFGDWREEIVYPTSDSSALRVYSTTTESEYKIKTLMHDPVYRSGVAAEQTAYNQPPHVGMYMGSEVFAAEVEKIEITSMPKTTVFAVGEKLNTSGMAVKAYYVDGTSENITAFTTSGYDPEVAGEQTITVSYLGAEATFNVTVMAIERIEIETPPTQAVYLKGQEIDTTGMVVKAYFEGGLERYVTDYEVGDFNPMVIGDKVITITYREKTAEFTVSFKEISGITVVSPPSKTTYYQGQSIDTEGMIVHANYSDGTSSEVTGYSISGYDALKLGEQTVTVKYNLKSATFTVNVIPATIASLNNTYSTTSTEGTVTEVPIGSYSGNFIVEHTMTINSMPANGSNNRNSTAGYFVRFMPQAVGTRVGVGGGWYLISRNNSIQLYWKAENAGRVCQDLVVGETYTLRYEFSNVGTGSGASVTLTVLDSTGSTLGSFSDLSLRNMTNSDSHTSLPLAYVQVYNQANSGSTASVTLDNARVYSNSEIVSVNGKDITLNLTTTSATKLYAAKYDNGVLTDVEDIELTKTGENVVVSSSFEPDKVFLWSNMYPVDMWIRPAE